MSFISVYLYFILDITVNFLQKNMLKTTAAKYSSVAKLIFTECMLRNNVTVDFAA